MAVRRLVIWAHSECRSNAALYASVRNLAEERGVAFKICLWNQKLQPESRNIRIEDAIPVGEDYARGLAVLREFGGVDSAQVFCVYQNSSVWRRLIVEAKRGGARVVVNAEAPCEMCLGVRAWLKRMYYRWILPWRVRSAVKAADLFLSASGELGVDRLIHLGWPKEKIVPFGYASPRLSEGDKFPPPTFSYSSLRVLHLGSEAKYRGVRVAEEAAKLAGVELVRTGGKMSGEGLVGAIHGADVVVGCGLCEPWGMRINDVLLEGVPVVVSDGMGVSWVVERYGCGCVVPKGDAKALAAVLKRCKDEPGFLDKRRSGAQVAAKALLPENRAKEWLELVAGEW